MTLQCVPTAVGASSLVNARASVEMEWLAAALDVTAQCRCVHVYAFVRIEIFACSYVDMDACTVQVC